TRVVIAAALVALALTLALAARPHEASANERVDRITAELRCPVCQGLSVKDSPSDTARQMRDLVVQRVGEGKTDAQIEDEFRAARRFATGAAVVAPLLRRPAPWPADPPDQRDDLARAVSSLRDLEFARAAGTIAPGDYRRLRAALERAAFARRAHEAARPAPVRTLLAAALIVAVVSVVAAVTLPRAAGDRAPG